MSKEEELYHAIFYVDGSAYPNPGYWGAGLHGYMYGENSIGKKSGDKPNNYIISNLGYLETNNAAKLEYQTVIPTFYMDGYTTHDGVGTNNTAEVVGIIEAINYVVNYSSTTNTVKSLIIKTDSKYAIHIYDKLLKDPEWRLTVTKNVEYWEMMENAINYAKANGLDIAVTKVLGHSTSLGNNLADRLAYLGRELSTRNSKNDIVIKATTGKYWKPKIEKHPLIPYKQLFFLNGQTEIPMYAILNYKTDVEPGKKSHEASFGLVMPKNKIPEIENVMTEYMKHLKGINLISSVNLDVLYSQFVYHYHKLFGNDIFSFNYRGRRYLSALEGEPIVTEVYPPGLAKQALEKVIMLSQHIADYRERDKVKTQAIYTDITGMFFQPNEKGVPTITIDNTLKYVTVDYTTKTGIQATIPLQLGKDIINRNQLKKLEKLDPVVTLLTHELQPGVIEYHVIIETRATEDYSIWCNFFSNKVFLNTKKEKKK